MKFLKIFVVIHLCSVVGAAAGETTTDEQGALDYAFTICKKPDAPVLATDRRLSGAVTRKARNRAIIQYNAHVEAVNAYLKCVSDEARADLDAYYAAVTATLQREQAHVLGRADALYQSIDDR